MKLSTRKTLAACALAAAALALPPTNPAQQTDQPQPSPQQTEQRQRTATKPQPTASAKQLKDASKKAESAARVFEQIMGAPDRSIPSELLDKAEAVAVFPGMLKAGLGIGARGGSGLISRRVTGGDRKSVV